MTARLASLLMAGFSLVVALQAVAQPPSKPIRSVGLLVPGSLQTQNDYPVFVDALRKLGYREGENLRLVPKEAAGRFESFQRLSHFGVEKRRGCGTEGWCKDTAR